MQITVYINTIHQKRGEPTLVTAANGGKDGPPLLRFQLSEQQMRDVKPRMGMPIRLTLGFDQ